MITNYMTRIIAGLCVLSFICIANADIIDLNQQSGFQTGNNCALNMFGFDNYTRPFVIYDIYLSDHRDGIRDYGTSQYTIHSNDYLRIAMNGLHTILTFNKAGCEQINTDIFIGTGYPDLNYVKNEMDFGSAGSMFTNYNNGIVFNHLNIDRPIFFRGFGDNFREITDNPWNMTNSVIATNASSSVPEPGMLILLISGIMGLAGFSFKKH